MSGIFSSLCNTEKIHIHLGTPPNSCCTAVRIQDTSDTLLLPAHLPQQLTAAVAGFNFSLLFFFPGQLAGVL